MFSLIYQLYSEYEMYFLSWNFKKVFERKVENGLVPWKKTKYKLDEILRNVLERLWYDYFRGLDTYLVENKQVICHIFNLKKIIKIYIGRL